MFKRGDAALEAALESLKLKTTEDLHNATTQTYSNLAGAMDRMASTLAKDKNMTRQANEMGKVKQDFEGTTNPDSKFNIAQTLAKTLVSTYRTKTWSWLYLTCPSLHTGYLLRNVILCYWLLAARTFSSACTRLLTFLSYLQKKRRQG